MAENTLALEFQDEMKRNDDASDELAVLHNQSATPLSIIPYPRRQNIS